jgi:protein translocase SecG subunit
MGIILGILIVIEVITSILLIGLILLQKSKDEGLGLAFGGAMGETLFGSRAGNVLTKITIVLACVFLANTLLIGYLMATSSHSTSITDSLPPERQAPAQQQAAPTPQVPLSPDAPAAAPEAAAPAPAVPSAAAPANPPAVPSAPAPAGAAP